MIVKAVTKICSRLARFGGAAALIGALMVAAPAQAQTPEVINTTKDWSALTFMEDGNRVCYMTSQPKKAEGNYTRRGDIHVLVTHRPAMNSTGVVSFVAGYSYKEGSEVTVKIGNKTFNLFTDNDTAWARTDEVDRALVQAIQKGSKMIVTGYSRRGTRTVDTYSLSGSSAAFQAISKACGVR